MVNVLMDCADHFRYLGMLLPEVPDDPVCGGWEHGDVVSDALARDDRRLDEALEPSCLYLVRGIAATDFCGKIQTDLKGKALVVSSAMLL